jgi:hypothetical protein
VVRVALVEDLVPGFAVAMRQAQQMTSQASFVAELISAGSVPAEWANAFAAVDRAAFIPDRCWFTGLDGYPQPRDRGTKPDRWRAAVYSDEPIVTQLDEGRTCWPATSPGVSSSASQPTVVLERRSSSHAAC